jgi:2'-5' RNA ligase
MTRWFVALPLPPRAHAAAAARLPARAPGIRPVRAADLHLTLQFLGDVDPEPARSALATVAPAPVAIGMRGGGVFPGRSGGVWWAGVAPDPGLRALRAAVGSALGAAGFPQEGRPWRPHVTLARAQPHVLPAATEAFCAAIASLATEPEPVPAFALFSSTPSPEGPPRYAARWWFPLGA